MTDRDEIDWNASWLFEPMPDTGPPGPMSPTPQAQPPSSGEQPPEQPPARQPDPGRVELEELRRRERGRGRANEITPPSAPPWQGGEGTTWLSEELERSGFFVRQEAEHASDRSRARQDAARQSAERATAQPSSDGAWWMEGAEVPGLGGGAEVLSEAPFWVAENIGQVPGGVVAGGGSFLQSPDVMVAHIQYAEQGRRLRMLEIADSIDREGGAPRPRPGEALDQPISAFTARYLMMTPEERATERARLQTEIASFNPAPIQERTLYRAGEAVQEFGRNLVPHVRGYDEQSVASQMGRGLGSMIGGLGARFATGPLGAATFFAGMGTGEATARAVQFDRTERAAGRPGLTQEQIILAGLLGVGPGTTDILPVEALVNRLNLPGGPAARSMLARVFATVGGRVVTQASVEGGQEGLQQILQNLIAQQVYNPSQSLTEEAWWNAVIGAGVGAESELGRTALARLAHLRRGGRTTAPPPRSGEEADAEARAANCGGASAVVCRDTPRRRR